MKSPVHPTAETVYNALKTEYPRLSLATVYRNLNQLCEMGLLRRLHLPDSPDRFDGTTTQHYHLYCTSCASVIDLRGSISDWHSLFAGEIAHRITGCDIVFYGICENCLAKRENGGPAAQEGAKSSGE